MLVQAELLEAWNQRPYRAHFHAIGDAWLHLFSQERVFFMPSLALSSTQLLQKRQPKVRSMGEFQIVEDEIAREVATSAECDQLRATLKDAQDRLNRSQELTSPDTDTGPDLHERQELQRLVEKLETAVGRFACD